MRFILVVVLPFFLLFGALFAATLGDPVGSTSVHPKGNYSVSDASDQLPPPAPGTVERTLRCDKR